MRSHRHLKTQAAQAFPPTGGGGGNQPIITTHVDTHGVGTTVQSASPQNINTYGNDIANFMNFKGNDKHDAMRMTMIAANDVKKAYMQLQKEFPGMLLEFDPMPDPKTAGKKREGFMTYQMALEAWKDVAFERIKTAREVSTVDIVNSSTAEITANNNRNALMNAGVTLAATNAAIENNNENTEKLAEQLDETKADLSKGLDKVNKNVTGQGNRLAAGLRKLQGSVEGYGNKILDEFDGVHQHLYVNDYRDAKRAEDAIFHREMIDARNANRTQKIIKNTNQKHKQTQELNGISDKISDVLTNGGLHTTRTVTRISNMRNQILQSNISYAKKKALLTHLASFSTQTVISDRELAAEQKKINKELK